MRYKFEDKKPIEANSPQEIVAAIRRDSMNPAENDFAYMEDFAQRYEIQTGTVIRSDTYENFVEDLIAAGYLMAL